MNLFIYILLSILILLPITHVSAEEIHQTHHTATQSRKALNLSNTPAREAIDAYGRLPLYFIENRGQAAEDVKFYEIKKGHAVFFTKKGLVLVLTKYLTPEKNKTKRGWPRGIKGKKIKREALRLSFIGSNIQAELTAEDRKSGHINYFAGSDKSRWRSNIPAYGALIYREIYKDIDIRFYGTNKNIEHDVIVKPGGDISKVKFAYEGAQGLEINKDGDLEVTLKNGVIIEKKPFVYEETRGGRVPVKGAYRIFKGEDGAFTYGFDVVSYDHTKTLVIDPALVYSTYLGGAAGEVGDGITIDNAGSVYITGLTLSPDYPVLNPIQGFGGASYSDAIITKLNPMGNAIIYSTYLGGAASDGARSIAVDNSGAAYVTGWTSSTDFPLTSPIQPIHGGVTDAFITKLSPAGNSIVYSALLGGSDEDWGNGIAVDTSGAAYVTGFALSTDFPLAAPVQGIFGGGFVDAFVAKVNPAGDALIYSTYLGGNSGEFGNGIVLDSSGAVYVTGQTFSTDFPLALPLQSALNGNSDAYITKVDPAGAAFVYSTYLGGSGDDAAEAITHDSSGAVYVTGYTSSADFPLSNPLQGTKSGLIDAFIAKLNPMGSAIAYSTYIGGGLDDYGRGVAVDNTGAAYVTGYTFSTDFPLVDYADGYFSGNSEAFVTAITPDGSALIYSTYLGGSDFDYGLSIRVDGQGSAYVTGETSSTDFPLSSPMQGLNAGPPDVFISKISAAPIPLVTFTVRPDAANFAQGSTLGYTVTATNTTTATECFQYWENATLPGGSRFPAAGELLGPVDICLKAGVTQAMHLVHGLPIKAKLGIYSINSFIGTHPTPILKTAAFNFNMTGLSPANKTPHSSWRLLENGFSK